MTDEFTTTRVLGWIDGEPMKKDYAFVATFLGMDRPYDVSAAFTTTMLDGSVLMDASKIRR
jgi:NitT/TauT family transport system substrate-binding protein